MVRVQNCACLRESVGMNTREVGSEKNQNTYQISSRYKEGIEKNTPE